MAELHETCLVEPADRNAAQARRQNNGPRARAQTILVRQRLQLAQGDRKIEAGPLDGSRKQTVRQVERRPDQPFVLEGNADAADLSVRRSDHATRGHLDAAQALDFARQLFKPARKHKIGSGPRKCRHAKFVGGQVRPGKIDHALGDGGKFFGRALPHRACGDPSLQDRRAPQILGGCNVNRLRSSMPCTLSNGRKLCRRHLNCWWESDPRCGSFSRATSLAQPVKSAAERSGPGSSNKRRTGGPGVGAANLAGPRRYRRPVFSRILGSTWRDNSEPAVNNP